MTKTEKQTQSLAMEPKRSTSLIPKSATGHDPTGRPARIDSIPASYSGDAVFKSRPGDRLS
jgi:hypothetical protein